MPVIRCSGVERLSRQAFSLTVETDHVTVGAVTELETCGTLIATEFQQNARIVDKYLKYILTKYSIVHISAGETLLREISTGCFIIFSAVTKHL